MCCGCGGRFEGDELGHYTVGWVKGQWLAIQTVYTQKLAGHSIGVWSHIAGIAATKQHMNGGFMPRLSRILLALQSIQNTMARKGCIKQRQVSSSCRDKGWKGEKA